MKKILAIVCCIAIIFSFSAISTFAAETPDTTVVVSDNTNASRATTQGLWYREDLYFATNVTTVVKPDSGSTLNLWLKNSGYVKVTVYKTNALGTYSSVFSQGFYGSGERDITVVSSCNGKNYLVKFEPAADGSVMSALLYQH